METWLIVTAVAVMLLCGQGLLSYSKDVVKCQKITNSKK